MEAGLPGRGEAGVETWEPGSLDSSCVSVCLAWDKLLLQGTG